MLLEKGTHYLLVNDILLKLVDYAAIIHWY